MAGVGEDLGDGGKRSEGSAKWEGRMEEGRGRGTNIAVGRPREGKRRSRNWDLVNERFGDGRELGEVRKGRREISTSERKNERAKGKGKERTM